MKKCLTLVLAVALCLTAVAALAAQGVAYGVYSFEGEHPDSLIRATVDVADGVITAAAFDEKLIPVTVSGAEGWAEVEEETAAKLGDAVVKSGEKVYAASLSIGGEVWTVAEDLTVSNDAHGELLAYLCTDEGGAWYYAQESADLLDAQGQACATVTIGTKESTEHGVHFWPSALLFPGNIEALEQFVVANGTDYTLDDMKLGENGWQVADALTGATLAGAPNHLLLAQKAYEKAE